MATSLEHQRSKQPVTRAAGPYGHPIHPVLVPIPIGAWTASFVFDLISRVHDDGHAFVLGSTYLLLIGLVGAVFAALAGFMDYSRLASGTRTVRTATLHGLLNVAATVLVLANYLMHTRVLPRDETPGSLIALSAVVLVLVGVSGWLGGRLAYTYGVRVADERTQAEGFEFVGRRNRVESGEGINAPKIT